MRSRISSDRTFKLKTIPFLLAFAAPALSHAQEASNEVVLPTVSVSGQAMGQTLGETTEGTGSYTVPATSAATHRPSSAVGPAGSSSARSASGA